MGHTNETSNYHLPQFVGTDKPTWLGDVNGAMLTIDGAIAGVASDATGAVSVANGAATLATSASEAASAATTTAEAASTAATNAASVANTAADTANNAQSTAVLAKSTADTASATATAADTKADEAKAAAIRGSVEVTADGVKTISALLDELYALIDSSKVSDYAKLVTVGVSRNRYNLISTATTGYFFSRPYSTANAIGVYSFTVASNGSTHGIGAVDTNNTFAYSDYSSNVMTAGDKIIIEY